MFKILSIFGTRPEAIKMAPVVHALNADTRFESLVCVTAQHREMLDQVLSLFEIVPDFDLNLMRPGQNLHELTARALFGLKSVLDETKPDMVLVHGDTTTALCGTLASFYSQIPVGHVEAGLRTGDFAAPFPEEANRVLTDAVSTLHFAPTQRSRSNLLKEGKDPSGISVTGNTVIDALLWMTQRLPALDNPQIYGSAASLFSENRKDERVVLVTGHRRESFGSGFERICQVLKSIAIKNPDVSIVYPVHLNPKVQKPVHELLANISNIHLIPPLDYQDFVRMMNRAHLILTDSGGIQEEAPSLNKPTLVMRDKTERPEGIDAGVVKLVGTQVETIVYQTQLLLDSEEHYKHMQEAKNPYGDGTAALQIADAIAQRLSST